MYKYLCSILPTDIVKNILVPFYTSNYIQEKNNVLSELNKLVYSFPYYFQIFDNNNVCNDFLHYISELKHYKLKLIKRYNISHYLLVSNDYSSLS